jgi:RNA 2',3'-cyclic 3'-phosphodiesterase
LSEVKFNNLFFALWPDQEVRSELTRLQQDVCGKNGRLHHPQDLHMTLVFLGRVTPEQLPCVRQAADAVVVNPFTLGLDRTGYWKRPRILWCGPDEIPEQLSQLVLDLQQSLTTCGFKPEKRIYSPHVTLARKASSIEHSELLNPVVWQANEFVLAGSHSGYELPRYTVLDSWYIKRDC